MKRGNESGQLSREQFEAESDEEEHTEIGTFSRASDDVLATRKMVKRRVSQASKIPSNPLGDSSGLSSAPFANPFSNFTGFSSTPVPPAPKVDADEGKDKMKKLNEAILEWVEIQAKKHPVSLWKDGLNDYIRQAGELQEKYSLKEGGTMPVSEKHTSITGNAASGSGSKVAVKPTSEPFSTAAPASGFSFSAPSVAASSASSGFSFSAPSAAASSASSGFSFSAPSAAVTTGEGDEDDEGDEAEPILAPEKILRNENDTDNILYEEECKLLRFAKEENEWKDLGKGSLRITEDKDSKKQRLLIRNTLGRITLNANLIKGMNFEKYGKNGIKFIAVTDASGQMSMFTVRLKPECIPVAIEKLQNGRS